MNLTRLFPLHTRLIIGAIIVMAVLGLVTMKVNQMKATAYQAGVAACQETARQAVDKANAENLEATKALDDEINQYAIRLDAALADRRDRQTVVVNRVEERLASQPNCEVDPSIIALRNEARAAR